MDGHTFGSDSSVGSTRALVEARLPAVREQRRRLEERLAAIIAQEDAMVAVLEGLDVLAQAPLGERDRVQGTARVGVADEMSAARTRSAQEPSESPVAESGSAGAPAAGRGAGRGAGPRKAVAKKAAAKKATARKAAAPAKRAAAKPAAEKAAAAGTREQDAAPAPAPAVKRAARSASKRAGTTAARGKAAPAKATEGAGSPTTPPRTVAGRRRLTDAQSVLAVLGQGKGPLRAKEVTVLLGLDDQNGALNAVRTMLERLAKTGRAQRTGRGLYDAVAG
ncbi:hypothetical protein [Kitasatospora cathayae]|uniref:Prephenate dehydrogenase n=1 Tax=Kitasatospora cathayae TaxID=3004092 RepID=A0ABY7QF86_9ACTN|nr:hypothetical protein [Kitasatospora sp. HUAS 3-15]WBP91375.1 hypothetical protein O1G21_39530 [Kitasatospora sp. HUAS 3-15]